MFAVIFISNFAMQAAVRMDPAPAGRPLALMEELGRKAVVTQVNGAARAAGVAAGMTAPQVVARCSEVILRSRSPSGERSAHEALVTAAFTLAPRVEETAEGICTIDLAGVPRAGLKERAVRLVEELGKLGLHARIGFARNPLLALMAARQAEPVLGVEDEKGFLATLPLAAADPPPHLAQILEQWGIRTLGGLAGLSRQAVAKRLGEEGIALWDRACGRGERVLRLATLPEEFEERLELEHEVETLEPLLFILRRFIDQLSLRLGAVYRVAEEVRLELGLSDDSRYERLFRLPEPTRDADLIFRMLHTHLEGVRTEHAITSIYLWMKPCRPVARQQDLFEAAVKDPSAFSETLARLVAVVGSGNVGSPRLEPTHRPDAFRLEPLDDSIKSEWSASPEEKPSRIGLPMRRFRPALAARVREEGKLPKYLEAPVVTGRIRRASGPWKLSGNWWDQHRWAREEWDIELATGGLYRLVREGDWWFLEGAYG